MVDNIIDIDEYFDSAKGYYYGGLCPFGYHDCDHDCHLQTTVKNIDGTTQTVCCLVLATKALVTIASNLKSINRYGIDTYEH